MTDDPKDFHADDDRPIGRRTAAPLPALIHRRRVLQAGAGLITWGALPGMTVAASTNPSLLTFEQPPQKIGPDHAVANGYDARALIGFGDPVLTGDGAANHFSANNDFIAFMPLPRGSDSGDHGLHCVNHEYTNRELMWPDASRRDAFGLSPDQMKTEMAAHGHSVIEVKIDAGAWRIVAGSNYARRLTATTPITISGLAAGHARMGIRGRPWYGWAKIDTRFDVETEPNEPNRFGWMVEIDPYDPQSQPVKRTALGRFKHEGAGVAITSDGRA
ncbi:MAG: alkaline phosphatase PhoX, partial [Rhodospirillaceae bacterium]